MDDKRARVTASMADAAVDVAIIVALREEFSELYSLLPAATPAKDETTGTSDYLFHYPLHPAAHYRCAATFVGTMGPTEAALATDRFLNRRRPRTMVMIGIAAGISDDVRLGDTVIATQVGRYLDRAKIVDGSGTTFDIRPGGDSFPCSVDLVRGVLDFEFAQKSEYDLWRADAAADAEMQIATEQRQRLLSDDYVRDLPRIVEGPVASGPVVAASSTFISWVKSVNRNYLALEMEGGSVLAAIYSRADSTRSLMIRGISDFGDARKETLDKIGKGGVRRYAMRNATRLLWRLLDASLLPRGGIASHQGIVADTLPIKFHADAELNVALATWKEKLSFLREAEGIASDAAQKFTLRKQIQDAEQRIAAFERE